MMILFLLILAFIFYAAGGICWIIALGERTEACPPVPSFNPKFWLPVWRTRSWFTPRGYRLHLAGAGFIGAGSLIGIFYFSGLLN